MISVNSELLRPVAEFPYLRRTVTHNNSDWPALQQNLWKARRWWEMVGKVVWKTGETMQARGMLYKVVLQSVFIYGSESCVGTGTMLKVL